MNMASVKGTYIIEAVNKARYKAKIKKVIEINRKRF